MDIQLIEQLQETYGFQITESEPAPRGFIGETYFVRCTNNSEYFVKVIEVGKFTALINSSTQVQDWLSLMVDFVQPVIKNLLNNRVSYFGNQAVVLYPRIKASPGTTNIQVDLLDKLLQQLHTLDLSKLEMKIKKEEFEPYFEKVYHQLISQINQIHIGQVEKQFQEYLSTKLTLTDQLYSQWTSIKQKCQESAKADFVLTHGDVLGNTLIDENGKILIVDWDDIILAPKERDYWMLEGIGQNIDKLYYSYYLYLRFFDDLTDWLHNIFECDLSQTEKAKQVENCKRDCFEEWLVPKIINSKLL